MVAQVYVEIRVEQVESASQGVSLQTFTSENVEDD